MNMKTQVMWKVETENNSNIQKWQKNSAIRCSWSCQFRNKEHFPDHESSKDNGLTQLGQIVLIGMGDFLEKAVDL
jgi:hypothetical protein